MNKPEHAIKLAALLLASTVASGCVTSTIVDSRTGETGINEGDTIVIMAKSYHLGNETELKYIRCIEDNLSRGRDGLNVIPHTEFIDSLFPGIRYIIWLDGDTDRVAGGGSLSCAAGPGGGGCFGFAWWQNDADYDASVWDLRGLESAGTVSADVSGTSFMPALVIPLPFIARTQSKACKSLADQLHNFIVQEPVA